MHKSLVYDGRRRQEMENMEFKEGTIIKGKDLKNYMLCKRYLQFPWQRNEAGTGGHSR